MRCIQSLRCHPQLLSQDEMSLLTRISRTLSKTKRPRPETVLKIKSFNFVSFVDVTVLGYILLEKHKIRDL